MASDLINQNVQFGITPCDADIGIPGATKFQAASIPVVMACGSGWTFPSIVGSYAFINVYGTAALGAAQAEFAAKQGWKRAYNLSSTEYFYGKNIGDIVCGSLQAARRQNRRDGLLQVRRHRLPRPRDPDRGQEAPGRHLDDRAPRLHDLPQAAPRSGLQGSGPGRRFVRHRRDEGGRKRPQQRVVHDPRLPDGSRGRRRSSRRSRSAPARRLTERSSRPAATWPC